MSRASGSKVEAEKQHAPVKKVVVCLKVRIVESLLSGDGFEFRTGRTVEYCKLFSGPISSTLFLTGAVFLPWHDQEQEDCMSIAAHLSKCATEQANTGAWLGAADDEAAARMPSTIVHDPLSQPASTSQRAAASPAALPVAESLKLPPAAVAPPLGGWEGALADIQRQFQVVNLKLDSEKASNEMLRLDISGLHDRVEDAAEQLSYYLPMHGPGALSPAGGWRGF